MAMMLMQYALYLYSIIVMHIVVYYLLDNRIWTGQVVALYLLNVLQVGNVM